MNWTDSTLDGILHLQFQVAWAGEGLCDPPRLGWWRTDLTDLSSGGDFLQRLAPRTHGWASLEAVREAARLADRKARQQMADPDNAVTLFFWGFALDEALSDRLRALKAEQAKPPVWSDFQRNQLESEWSDMGPVPFSVVSSGRQLRHRPEDPLHAARALVAALLPWSSEYPAPFFRASQA